MNAEGEKIVLGDGDRLEESELRPSNLPVQRIPLPIAVVSASLAELNLLPGAGRRSRDGDQHRR